MYSRQIIARSNSTLVFDGFGFMAMAIGLDNCSILPPFPPVLRVQDGVFARLAYLSDPSSLFAHLGVLARHQPVNRAFSPEGYLTLGRVPFNLVLRSIIESIGNNDGTAEENLKSIGRSLETLSYLPTKALRRTLQAHCIDHLGAMSQAIEEKLNIAPEFAQSHLQSVLGNLRKAAVRPELPPDLPGLDQESRLDMASYLLKEFGQLLQVWCDLREVAPEVCRRMWDEMERSR